MHRVLQEILDKQFHNSPSAASFKAFSHFCLFLLYLPSLTPELLSFACGKHGPADQAAVGSRVRASQRLEAFDPSVSLYTRPPQQRTFEPY